MSRIRWVKIALGLSLLFLLGCSGSSVPSLDDAYNWSRQAKMKMLQGEWWLETAEMEGTTLEGEDLHGLRILFQNDRVVIRVRGEVHRGKYELGAGKNGGLEQINITPAGDNKSDRALAGIYRIKNSEMVMTVSQKERPGGFKTVPGRDWITLRLRKR
jgi:uncharacterized protein (TIGR03067 family)